MQTNPICTVVYHFHPDGDWFTGNAFEIGTGTEVSFLRAKHLTSLIAAIELVCTPIIEFMSGCNNQEFVGKHRLNYLRKTLE